MKNRCNSPNNTNYQSYGGRGIKICDEWQDFKNFKDWAIANGYEDSLTIDRIDVNGDYTPSNCRWITQKEQCNNRRTTHLIEYNGEIHSMKQWSVILGIHPRTLKSRLDSGWSVERAFSQPTQKQKKKE